MFLLLLKKLALKIQLKLVFSASSVVLHCKTFHSTLDKTWTVTEFLSLCIYFFNQLFFNLICFNIFNILILNCFYFSIIFPIFMCLGCSVCERVYACMHVYRTMCVRGARVCICMCVLVRLPPCIYTDSGGLSTLDWQMLYLLSLFPSP